MNLPPLRRMAVAMSLFFSAAMAHAGPEWNLPAQPFQIFGNSYYVGVKGLSSVLITSPAGHVLLDGALPASAPLIAANIRALGFKVEDVKFILTSHDHGDHAGGVEELRRLSGATVLASPATAASLRRGRVGKDDPQLADLTPFPAVAKVGEVGDGEVVKLGPLAVTALYTPGHTPGGTSWTWRSCEQGRCVDIVFADSINPISSDGFKFTTNTSYPSIVTDFERSYAVLEGTPCDIVVSVHPDFTGLWEKVQSGKPRALLGNGGDCKRYVAQSRAKLAKRLASERAESLK
jgi:metallo-beta-lactamase class B